MGWVTEWSIVHAWKACVLKGTEGSNPSPSASDLLLMIVLLLLLESIYFPRSRRSKI